MACFTADHSGARQPTEGADTPLHSAAANGHRLEVIRMLQARLAPIDSHGENGYTALMLAAMHNHEDTVHALLEHGADVDLGNRYGYTALMCAAERGHHESVDLILAADADPMLQQNFKESALDLAFHLPPSGARQNTITLLRNAEKAIAGRISVQHWLGKIHRIQMYPIARLSETAANLGSVSSTARGFSKLQPLSKEMYRAAMVGDVKTAQQLLVRLEHADAVDEESGMSALMVAAWKGHYSVARTLLEIEGTNSQTGAKLAASLDLVCHQTGLNALGCGYTPTPVIYSL